MDFGALPPEVNSARMYAGPGSESMLAAASAWDGLAADLHSVATSYGSVITGLTDESWVGPSSTAMATAAAPYVAWMSATAGEAEEAAAHARAAAAAYHAAWAMMVSPPVIEANRIQLSALTATNLFGLNNPAIATTEAQYAEMWAQDAAAMYGYAGNSAAASTLRTFAVPPSTTNPTGLAAQGATAAQATGSSQASLSQLITTMLQNLASPAASASSGSGPSGFLSQLLNALGGGSAVSSASTTGIFGGVDTGSILTGLIGNYAYLPGFAGIFAGLDALSPIMNQLETIPPAAAAGGDAEGAAAAAAGDAGDAGAAEGAVGSSFAGDAGDFGAWGGLGESASIGPLSVPPNWMWSATPPLEMLAPAAAPLASPALDLGAGAGSGFPLFFGGLPAAAGVGAAAGAGGAAAVKYGSRSKVMARPPAAGYPAEPEIPSTEEYPVPATFPANGHAPPGYRPAIIYLPTNGHAPAKT